MKKIKSTYKKDKLFKPEWAETFSHYNQMDKATFYLAEFIWENKEELLTSLPESISIISFKSSYCSDRAYVKDPKVRNPAKFIYTLPSVKINVICGLLKWEGPVFCFLNKPEGALNIEDVSPWVFEFDETEEEIKIELKLSNWNKG